MSLINGKKAATCVSTADSTGKTGFNDFLIAIPNPMPP